MDVPNLLESLLCFHKSNLFGPSHIWGPVLLTLVNGGCHSAFFFFSWDSCLCLEGSFLGGAADCAQMTALKPKSWDEGMFLSSGRCEVAGLWEWALWHEASLADLGEPKSAQSSAGPWPVSRAQMTLGGFLSSAGYKRSSAWFFKELSIFRYICNLHSKQAVWNKYAVYIVFLALIHWFIMRCFLGNNSFSVGLEEKPKRNIMLDSVLIFQNKTCAGVAWPNLASAS